MDLDWCFSSGRIKTKIVDSLMKVLNKVISTK